MPVLRILLWVLMSVFLTIPLALMGASLGFLVANRGMPDATLRVRCWRKLAPAKTR
mgnify:CR=1 FL=1